MKYESDFNELEVWIDRNKMDSILRNLISNAIKYTPKGGYVDINASHNKKNWNIDITDTGIGIPKKTGRRCSDICSEDRTQQTSLSPVQVSECF